MGNQAGLYRLGMRYQLIRRWRSQVGSCVTINLHELQFFSSMKWGKYLSFSEFLRSNKKEKKVKTSKVLSCRGGVISGE